MTRTKKKNFYFEEREENAVVEYNQTDDKEKKNQIYNEILKPAFNKMVESIIRRYSLYVPDEEYDTTYNDCLSLLLTKIHMFKPARNKKAYSYLGTIVKNHLIFKNKKFNEKKEKYTSYDIAPIIYDEDEGLAEEDLHMEDGDPVSLLIDAIKKKIYEMIENKKKYKLTTDEVKVGQALLEILNNWENLFDNEMGSNKFNKTSILFFLRETTYMSTKEIRKNLKRYKTVYTDLKNKIFY